jgi:hypothetical protein
MKKRREQLAPLPPNHETPSDRNDAIPNSLESQMSRKSTSKNRVSGIREKKVQNGRPKDHERQPFKLESVTLQKLKALGF